MVTQLTKNAIDSLINSTNPDEQYVIQILQAPQLVADNLFKIFISDGFSKFKKCYFVSDAAMKCQELKELSIIKCKKYIDDSNQDKERIIISAYEIVYANITEPIGKPIEFKNYKQNNFQNPEGTVQIPQKYLSRNAQVLQQNQVVQPKSITPANVSKPPANIPNNFNQQKPAVSNQTMNRVNQNPNTMNKSVPVASNNNNAPLSNSTQSDETDLEYIKGLQPNTPCTIKVRITKKGDMKSFNKEKSGQLFSMDVIDAHNDETTVSFFNEIAIKYDGQFKVGQVLVLSNFSVKVNNNTQYNKGDYCITINKDSKILNSIDDGTIPYIKMSKKTISDIQQMSKDSTIDLVVIVKNDTELKNMTLKNGNQSMKRDIVAFDESLVETEITLWGETAKEFNAKKNDILVIKDAKIGEFREKKQLNIGYNTTVLLNPDPNIFQQVQALRNWAQNLSNDQLGAIQKTQGSFDNAPKEVTAFESSLSILKEEIGKAQPFDENLKLWKEVRAQILFIRDTPLYYNACPVCKKKVVADNESWYCSNCSKALDGPDSRYICSILIGDSSDTMWVSAFDEVGVKVFGRHANEFRYADENKDHGVDIKKRLIMSSQNKEFRILLVTKAERDQNGQLREKTIIHSIKDLQPAYEAKKMYNSLEKYLEIANSN